MRPTEGRFDRRDKVDVTDVLMELGTLHHASGLIPHSAQNERAAGGVGDIRECSSA